MSTSQLHSPRATGHSALGLRHLPCISLALLLIPFPASSQIPEPDNVVYGQIAIGPSLVTAQRTNVVIEVQNATGVLLSSYRMGQDANLGDHYAVEIGFWSPAAVTDPLPSPTGEPLTILVKEETYVSGRATNITRYTTNFVVGDRGYVERIDFGELAPPSDFDAWAALYGLDADSQDLDSDGDGFTNGQEFVAGTNPTDPNSLFALDIGQGFGSVEISFLALQAAGTGYTGKTRFYSLETADDPLGPWALVPNYSNVPGDNLTHVCVIPTTNAAPQFYRGQVDLR